MGDKCTRMADDSPFPETEAQRQHQLVQHGRLLHAERSKQLFEASAAMHRWVMASLLLLNTGAIATVLSISDGAMAGALESAIKWWALGACFAVLSGSVRSDADLINSFGWLNISTRDFDAADGNPKGNVLMVAVMRHISTAMQFVSTAAFAWGLDVAGKHI